MRMGFFPKPKSYPLRDWGIGFFWILAGMGAALLVWVYLFQPAHNSTRCQCIQHHVKY